MKIVSRTEESPLATVYIATNSAGKFVEFVESIQPPYTLEEKWVLIVSTLFGCPVDCSFCDAGGQYNGKLTADEILFQIDHPVSRRFPDGIIGTRKFKVQFSRMGEPSFNPAVLDVLGMLPGKYVCEEFIPSLSTIGPRGTDSFFNRLLELKKQWYDATFQLQFSIHSTSTTQRDRLIPVRKWDFGQISRYGQRFFSPGGKKITLNFAVSRDSIIEAETLLQFFPPEIFLVKLTPVNPTFKAKKHRIESWEPGNDAFFQPIDERIKAAGYETIVSIGELEENLIGSNCGQYIQAHLKACEQLPEAYGYRLMQ